MGEAVALNTKFRVILLILGANQLGVIELTYNLTQQSYKQIDLRTPINDF